jgi:hypothetical protein
MLLSLSHHPHRWIAGRHALRSGAYRGMLLFKPCSEVKERPISRLNLGGGSQVRLREGAARRRMV